MSPSVSFASVNIKSDTKPNWLKTALWDKFTSEEVAG